MKGEMNPYLNQLIDLAIEEDIGAGDITTEATVPPDVRGVGVISSKEDIVLAGLEAVKKVFERVSHELIFGPKAKDGDRIKKGDVIVEVKGPLGKILIAERIALNFLQHLSGIATLTNKFVEKAKGTKILDTRKTLPAYRALEKEAVRLGGGKNHRMGLYDMYLVKDNHIAAAGSITNALEKIVKNKKEGVFIEVEVKNLEELKEALKFNVDIIMLDNFSPEDVKNAAKLSQGKAKLEVSGNISLDNIDSFASLGVDYISIGALTHSAPASDISMLIKAAPSLQVN
jgi:nicotinate-nucleotide pyrophosphorylase (carboxylating)